jgi:hypothetical protein
MKKKREGIQINLSNRWLYTFIIVGILAIIGVGVYAIPPGVAPNPGHSLSDIGVPAGCSTNDSLKWSGTNLVCAHTTALYITASTPGSEGNLTFSPNSYPARPTCRTCTYNNVCGASSISPTIQTQCDGSCPACPSSCTCAGTPPYAIFCSNMPPTPSCPVSNTFKGFLIN